MADDWQAGDLALCVGGRGRRGVPMPGNTAVRRGGLYPVSEVCPGPGWKALVFEGHHSTHFTRGWHARCFRKIKPLSDAEREEALRDLKAPVREPAA